MKTIFTFLIFTFLSAIPFTNYAQNECNPYFVFEEGKKWTMANYNAKDKYQGKQYFEILSVSESADKLVANIKLIAYDKKDEVIMDKEIEYECEDGVIKMDMSQYMPEQMMESMKGAEMKIEYDDIQYPGDLSVGQTLDDGWIKMSMQGPMSMSFVTRLVDRKVVSKEDITVPAGTFNTYKINSVLEFEAMGSTRESKQIDWITKDVGTVRSESYDKKGRLSSYSVLTEYSE